jgi:Sarcosine oxidase gamma subunit
VVSGDDAGELIGRLVAALGESPGLVVDVSANRTTLELSGPSARAVLEKGCMLDLHPRAFTAGTAISTQIGPVPVILWQTDDAPTYRILPRASFSDYAARWLLDAMLEYAEPEVP